MLSRLYSHTSTRKESGFTLIELLVVVIVIGLLAAIALPIFIDQTKTAVDASVKADVRNTVTNVTNVQAQATAFPTSVKAAVSDANTSIALVAATTEVATKGSATSTLGNVPKLGESYAVHGWNPNGKLYLGTADSGKGAFSFNSTTGLFTQASGAAPAADATADPGNTGGSTGGSNPSPSISITTTSLPSAYVNIAYDSGAIAVSTANTTGTTTFAATSGLPSWASISSATGKITGTPTATGSATVHIVVTNGSAKDEKDFTLTVATAVAPTFTASSSLATATPGVAYSQVLQGTSGSPAATYSATGLPAGLSIDSATGKISGTVKDGTLNSPAYYINGYNDSPPSYNTRAYFNTIKVTATGSTTVSKTYSMNVQGTLLASGTDASSGWVGASDYPLGSSVQGTNFYRDITGLTVGAKYILFQNMNQGCDSSTIKVAQAGVTTTIPLASTCSYVASYNVFTATSTTARITYIANYQNTMNAFSVTRIAVP